MSSTKRTRQDPWPEMEKTMIETINDVVVQHQKFSSMPNRTVVAENDFRGVITNACELLEDTQHALNAVLEHPEMFAITAEELQRRGTLVRQWERDLKKPSEELAAAEKKRSQTAQFAASAAASGVSAAELEAAQNRRHEENGEYLRREYDAQQSTMVDQDAAVVRIAEGVTKIKNNTTLINEELVKQDVMLNQADGTMSKVQVKLEGALKKVDKLLDQSSDRNKFICIFVLLIILGLLVFFLFGN